MLDFSGSTTVYLACGVTDLHKSYTGLATIIKLKFHLDPYSRCMFAFCNRRRTLLKILQWDDPDAPEPDLEEVHPSSYKRKKRSGKKEEDLSSFETTEVIEYKLTGADRYCPDCNTKYKVVKCPAKSCVLQDGITSRADP